MRQSLFSLLPSIDVYKRQLFHNRYGGTFFTNRLCTITVAAHIREIPIQNINCQAPNPIAILSVSEKSFNMQIIKIEAMSEIPSIMM